MIAMLTCKYLVSWHFPKNATEAFFLAWLPRNYVSCHLHFKWLWNDMLTYVEFSRWACFCTKADTKSRGTVCFYSSGNHVMNLFLMKDCVVIMFLYLLYILYLGKLNARASRCDVLSFAYVFFPVFKALSIVLMLRK